MQSSNQATIISIPKLSFTAQMFFLSSNQQCQSTERRTCATANEKFHQQSILMYHKLPLNESCLDNTNHYHITITFDHIQHCYFHSKNKSTQNINLHQCSCDTNHNVVSSGSPPKSNQFSLVTLHTPPKYFTKICQQL